MQNYKRRQHTDAFKQKALRMVTDRGYSASDTAKRLAINTNMLRRWKRQAEASSNGVFSGNGHSTRRPHGR